MKKALRTCLVVILALSLVPFAFAGGKKEEAAKKHLKFGMVAMTMNHEFFSAMVVGAKKKAATLGADLTVIDSAFDQSKLNSAIEDLIVKKVDGIMWGPIDDKACGVLVDAMAKAGIPNVTTSTPMKGVTNVGVDDVSAGRLAGKYIGTWLNDKFGGAGEVAIIGYPYVQAGLDRVKGFKEGLSGSAPKAQIIAEQSFNGNKDDALKVFENILVAHPGTVAVFSINDDGALGALAAMESSGRKDLDKVIILGMGGYGEDTQKALKSGGPFRATVGFYSNIIGEKCIEALVDASQGKTLPPFVEVPVDMITGDKADAYFTNLRQ